MIKLHKQFGHPSQEKLEKLIINAGRNNEEVKQTIETISTECDNCKRYRRADPKPIVSLTIAEEFNEIITMDLKKWRNGYLLVIVDSLTRFCRAAYVKNKEPDTIINKLIMQWFTMFGPPKKIMTDNGGEFNNENMKELCERYNIEATYTAAESPWSNGIVERLNGILGEHLERTLMDGEKLEEAIAWVVLAQNSLDNNKGFSPNQLVFGKNPVLPNLLLDKPPALTEKKANSKIVEDNLRLMRNAREQFIKMESNEKIRRALNHRTRPSKNKDLNINDKVYFKREGESRWRGPGEIEGIQGKIIFVRYGGYRYRVHECRLQMIKNINNNELQMIPSNGNNNTDRINNSDFHVPPIHVQRNRRNTEEESEEETDENVEEEESEDTIEEENDEENEVENEGEEENTNEEENDEESEEEENEDENAASGETRNWRCKTPVIGRRFEAITPNDGRNITGHIISRAGKVGINRKGKYKDWFNVRLDGATDITNMDFATLPRWRMLPEIEETLIAWEGQEIMKAKEAEIQQWKDREAYEEVEDEGQKSISVRWVIKEKEVLGEKKVKARLVARGFEEDENMDKDSPTCSKEGLRAVLMLIEHQGWKTMSMDISGAYLQGKTMQRDVYLEPPKEYRNGNLWKLKKTVYGLKDAAREWYLSVRDALKNIGVKECLNDSAIYYERQEGNLQGIIALHVDDFIWGGNTNFIEGTIKKLKNKFNFGKEEEGNFKFLGMQIYRNEINELCMDQNAYVNTIDVIENITGKDYEALNVKETRNYRSLVGQLNWLSRQSRPDIAYEVSERSSYGKHPLKEDVKKLNKLVKKTKFTDVKLTFPKVKDLEKSELICYSDASLGNLKDGGSQGGYIVFWKNEENKIGTIAWRSRRLRRVAWSTLAAETLALVEAVDAAIFIKNIVKEITNKDVPIKCMVDNKSLERNLRSLKPVEEKGLRAYIGSIREKMTNGEIKKVEWIATNKQLANCLTKKGASSQGLINTLQGGKLDEIQD